MFQAAFHLQYSGARAENSNPLGSVSTRPALHQLDGDIVLYTKRQDWLSVHRLLLLRNLINQVYFLQNRAFGDVRI